jgi:hypothetical protein
VAGIPGVTVVHDAVTVNGERGIAVQRIFQGQSYQLIFSPGTHAFIGERQVAVAGTPLIKPDTVMHTTTPPQGGNCRSRRTPARIVTATASLRTPDSSVAEAGKPRAG